jgi:hypothetical protein
MLVFSNLIRLGFTVRAKTRQRDCAERVARSAAAQ